MNVNLSRLSIEKLNNGHICLRFSTIQSDKNHGYMESVYLTESESRAAIECLNGTALYYPYFDDGIHLIKFHPQGFNHLYTGNNKAEKKYIYFPGSYIAASLTMILEGYKDFTEFEPDFIYQVKCHVSPKIKVICQNIEDKTTIQDTIKRLLSDDKVKNDVIRFIRSIVRIAKNSSSMGDRITVHLSYDGYKEPDRLYPSFYWCIMTDDNKRVMNGGLIAHPNYHGTNEPDFNDVTYSIHT